MVILVEGLGYVQTEKVFTDSTVVDQYRNQIKIFEKVLSKDKSQITADDAAALGQARASLLALASGGVSTQSKDPITGDTVVSTKLVTQDMARQIDLLLRSMTAAGITGSPDVTGVLRWKDLGVEGVNLVVIRAAQAIDNNRSLQSLLELEYVRTGNEVLAEQLNKLYDAMTATQKVAKTLTSIQDVRNLLKPEERKGIDMTGVTNINQYNTAADAAYKDPIKPVVDYQGRNVQDVINSVYTYRAQLGAELTELDKLNPPQIDNNGMAVRDPSSLAGQIDQVLKDMKRFFEDGGNGNPDITQPELEAWIIDNVDKKPGEPGADTAGDAQRHLEAAIQASTNLNDRQKEDFRRYMFVFEEFYKSASAMLNAINQLIAKMAQNAGR